MALRAASRRAANGSMTILGDIAQATGVAAQESWDALTAALGLVAEQVRRRELTVGYRVPGPILDYANQLLSVTAPDITPSSSIRSRGRGPEHHRVEPDSIAPTVAAVAQEIAGDWSTIGVVAPRHRMDRRGQGHPTGAPRALCGIQSGLRSGDEIRPRNRPRRQRRFDEPAASGQVGLSNFVMR